MKKRTRLIAGVMAMMLTLGGCGSAANTANKKEATQTTAEQTASSQEDVYKRQVLVSAGKDEIGSGRGDL